MKSATTWPLRDIARAADMKPRALRQYFDTHILKFRGDDKCSTGTGVPVGLSRNRAYEAATVQHLTRLGMTPSRAALAVFDFTLSGGEGRGAGQLFKHGKTILTIGPNGPAVSQVDFDAKLFDLSNCGVAVVVDLNKIVSDVNAVLDNS
jgi:hypothetical protein